MINYTLIAATQLDHLIQLSSADFSAHYFNENRSPRERAIVALDQDKGQICGYSLLFNDPNMQNIHSEMVFVAKDYRHMGIGTALLEEQMKLASAENKALSNNGFTTLGKNLIETRERLAKQYGVALHSGVGRC